MNETDSYGDSPPYFDLDFVLPATPLKSSAPLTTLYCPLATTPSTLSRAGGQRGELTLIPGKSLVRPPLIMTTLCSCKLCPSPGIYAIVLFPVDNLTRQTLRTAELGFLGLVVYIFEQTALR
jgi:hypothetical protein